MFNALEGKALWVIGFGVEADDGGDSDFLKDRNIFFGSEKLISVFIDFFVRRRTEGNEFAGNNPIQISIFDSFVVLVLLDVKTFKIKPPQLYCIL